MPITTAHGGGHSTRAAKLRVGLGTFIAIHAEASEGRVADAAIDVAWDAIKQVERLMHPQRAGSDLAGLNHAAPGALVRLHAWTYEVLAICRELHAASNGAFDPCLHESSGRLDALELLAPDAARPHAALRIDLGGVAKGYAVDRALEALRAAGCRGGLVNAGGDVAAFGATGHAIRCGRAPDAPVFELRNGALASTDTRELERPPEHCGYYHGVDRGMIVTGRVTVSAPRAALADGLAKCALLCGEAQRAALLERFGARLVSCAPG